PPSKISITLPKLKIFKKYFKDFQRRFIDMQLPNLVEKYLFLKKLQRFYEKIQKIKLTKLIQMQNNNNKLTKLIQIAVS
ncbi:hypothetical protein, partial [Aquabacterium sp.]|uniref:hypothetical protein n=1 Tax=Aquabacterium sp. TaxID=1872578 RepID=UPI003D6CF3C6